MSETPIFDSLGGVNWPCGHVGHDASFWEDEEAGVLWCPGCGTEYHLGKADAL